jgi:hypothetical protein
MATCRPHGNDLQACILEIDVIEMRLKYVTSFLLSCYGVAYKCSIHRQYSNHANNLDSKFFFAFKGTDVGLLLHSDGR